MAENETTGPDGFVRNPEVDYSGIPESPIPDPSADIAPIPGVDPGTAQDTQHDIATPSVSSEATAHHQETVRVVGEVDADGTQDLLREWGDPGSESFAENFAHARHATQELTTPALLEVLDGAGLGDHPLVLRIAADIGRRMAEGGSNTGLTNVARTPANIGKAESVNAELDALMSLMNTDPDKYKQPATQRRIKALTTALGGDDHIVGSGGRTA